MIIGHRSRWFEDESRPAWRSPDWPRDLALTCWYPAMAGSLCADLIIGPPDDPAFILSDMAKDADPVPGPHPVVLLSLGDSASPYALHGLARDLVAKGFIVLGIHHHGTGTIHPLHLEGQLAWWEAARDLSFLLDCVANEGPLAGHLNLTRVSALGAGSGALAVLFLLGACLEDTAWQGFAAVIGGEEGAAQLEGDPVFQESWSRRTQDYREPRIKAACLLCPSSGVEALNAVSLREIETPILLVSDGGSVGAAEWLKARLPGARIGDTARIAEFLRSVGG